jgi:hypothetical protein
MKQKQKGSTESPFELLDYYVNFAGFSFSSTFLGWFQQGAILSTCWSVPPTRSDVAGRIALSGTDRLWPSVLIALEPAWSIPIGLPLAID